MRDSDIRVLRTDLNSAQKKIKNHSNEVKRYEETLHQVQKDLERTQENHRNSTVQITNLEKNVQNLKVQLAGAHGNHKEAMDQLAQRSKTLANTKTELATTKQQTRAMEEQILALEDKVRKFKTDLKRTQDKNKYSEGEIQQYSRNIEELKSQLGLSQDKLRKETQEATRRDEQLVVLKVELATLQEKFRLTQDENEKLKQEFSISRQQHQSCLEEVQTLRVSLEDARANGDRLHRESELVVENVNSWVKEQKQGNERLAGRLREQEARISSLQSEKERLLESNESLKKESSIVKTELDERRMDSERLKALQSHSAQQQVLLHQLRNRLQEFENDQDTEAMSKAQTIEDLHSRLKNNVETIQQLNQQLNSLNKENLRQRHIIDREASARKGLQLQLDSRDQTIMALKSQVESYKFADVPHRDTDNIMDAYGLNDSAYSSLDKGLQKSAQKDKMRSAMRKEMDKAGVNDPQVLDKSYWIQRVAFNPASTEQRILGSESTRFNVSAGSPRYLSRELQQE
ncbi:PREDICTED: polyamine-modulated factor 1-binding protein 1-like isoform X1 [Acropora digitifera]|uniref:polyamine-modulated factor 1-binding protein 1-like isoform X1 n=1 Tax=Acropora digitifera TaxID=70779 RepID=UPI00077A7678|nr:PREDICTED: polyamine-modulated factor 1-binding protein 1-like isoform X1 [Acropora digitifera]